MVTTQVGGGRPSPASAELLLRETSHRSSNDLQLVIGMLALQSRRAENPEVRQALADAMERVGVLARARRDMFGETPQDLHTALRQVCEALQSQAEQRGILVAYVAGSGLSGLLPREVTTLALVVNELATNAVKHAFDAIGTGRIRVSSSADDRDVRVLVDDDGSPFPVDPRAGGMGLGLAKRLMASIDGLLISPEEGSKAFELRVCARPRAAPQPSPKVRTSPDRS